MVNSSGTLHYSMSYIRKIVRQNKNGEKKEYYAEVECVRINGKVVQRHIRSFGSNPKYPSNFPINTNQFSYLAVRLAQGDLTPTELFDMLEDMGQPVLRDSLERIGITYNIEKKTFSIYLYYQGRSKKSQKNAPSAKRDSSLNEKTNEP